MARARPKPPEEGKKQRAKPAPRHKDDRGEYRSTFAIILDSPEWHALTPIGRAIWWCVKMKLGKAGIGVLYPEELMRPSGWTYQQCVDACDELERGDWIRRQGPLMWLRNGLRFEPSAPLASETGRIGIFNHLRTLPKVQIVNEFAVYYGLEKPFSDIDAVAPKQSPAHAPGMAPTGPQQAPNMGPQESPEQEAPSRAPASPRLAQMTETETDTEDGEQRDASQVPTVPVREQPPAAPPPPHTNGNGSRSVDDELEDFVSEVICLANRGMMDAGIDYKPLLTTGKHRQPVFDWLEQGYSRDVIRSAVYHTALSYKPDADNPQISSMGYFSSAVKRTHTTGQVSKVEVPPDSVAGRITSKLPKDREGNVDERPLYRPKGSMADRDTNGPTEIVDTLNQLISKSQTQLMDERVKQWEADHPDDAEWLRQELEDELDGEITAAAEVAEEPEEWPAIRRRLELAGRFLTRVRAKIAAEDAQQHDSTAIKGATPSEVR